MRNQPFVALATACAEVVPALPTAVVPGSEMVTLIEPRRR
jgi:hypothetical protein